MAREVQLSDDPSCLRPHGNDDRRCVRMRTRTKIVLSLVPALVLASMATTAHAEPKNQIQVFMLSSGIDDDARARIMVVENKAQAFFNIHASHLDPGASYDVTLNGGVVETVTAN